jgi:predicted O-methyltransferase YrrM
MQVFKYINVVHRRLIDFDDSESDVIAQLEVASLIETHMTFEERIEMFRLACSLPQGFTACEIGSYVGASTMFLAIAARLRGGRVHAVDTWQNDAMGLHEPKEDTFERFSANTRDYRDTIAVHRGRASDLKDEVPALDLLFLDGDHSYEGTRENLADYGPKLKSPGFLLLHDFDQEGVRRAVAENLGAAAVEGAGLTGSLKILRVVTQ